MKSLSLFLGAMVVGFLCALTIRTHFALKKPPPLTLPSGAPFGEPLRNTPSSIKMVLQWGGYYVVRESDGYTVFRLIDIDQTSYHVATYERRFEYKPGFQEVSFMIPSRRHVALNCLELLTKEPEFIGYRQLQTDDVFAYAQYLEKKGIRGRRLNSVIYQIQKRSREQPLLTKISAENGEFRFGPALPGE